MGDDIGRLFNWHIFVTQFYGDKYWKFLSCIKIFKCYAWNIGKSRHSLIYYYFAEKILNWNLIKLMPYHGMHQSIFQHNVDDALCICTGPTFND